MYTLCQPSSQPHEIHNLLCHFQNGQKFGCYWVHAFVSVISTDYDGRGTPNAKLENRRRNRRFMAKNCSQKWKKNQTPFQRSILVVFVNKTQHQQILCVDADFFVFNLHVNSTSQRFLVSHVDVNRMSLLCEILQSSFGTPSFIYHASRNISSTLFITQTLT